MNLTTLLKAADLFYQYTEEDKAVIRKMAMEDRAGLTAALEADPLIPWVAYENGLIDEAPNGGHERPVTPNAQLTGAARADD